MATSTISYTPKVVESGRSGIWTYRKWSDGTAECWGFTSVATQTYSANGGNYNVIESLPSGLFNTTPNIVLASGNLAGIVGTDIGYTAPNNSTSVQTYLVNRSTTAVTVSGFVYWIVKGTWR